MPPTGMPSSSPATSPLPPIHKDASPQSTPSMTASEGATQDRTASPEVNLNEPARIELGRKKEQMAIAVGFWEQRVESYKKLLGSCEAQLSSSRAELRATEKKLARLGEEFSAYGPQATHVISAPNWAAEVVMDGESRLAHLAAIDTPVRVSLFGSIESEKQNLAKLLVPVTKSENSATQTDETIPNPKSPITEKRSIFMKWIAINGNSNRDDEARVSPTSSNKTNSPHNHNQPPQTDKQPETPSDGDDDDDGDDYPSDHRVTVKRVYGGYLNRRFHSRGSHVSRGNGRGSSRARGTTNPRGTARGSVTRPRGNPRTLKRSRTDDRIEGEGNSHELEASDCEPSYSPKHFKQETAMHKTDTPSRPEPQRQSPLATESEVFEIFIEEPEGAMAFSRANISWALGGNPLRTWVLTGQGGNAIYKVDQYFCPMRERNPYLPTKPGENGYVHMWPRQIVETGQVYELFIPDNSKKWRYFGKYLVSRTRKVTLAEWMIFPEANQIWWCRQVLKEKWGLQMLLAEALVTKSEYKTCTVEKVRGFFNRPDGEKNLRLNVLNLVSIGYNREVYQALIESLDWD